MSDKQHGQSGRSRDTDVSPWALAGLGVQFAVALVFFAYAGQWVDRYFNTAPAFLLIGVLAGAGGTFYLSFRRLTAPPSNMEQSPDRPSTPPESRDGPSA